MTTRPMIPEDKLQAALGTEETHSALIEAARNARQAELKYAEMVRFIESSLGEIESGDQTTFEKQLLRLIRNG